MQNEPGKTQGRSRSTFYILIDYRRHRDRSVAELAFWDEIAGAARFRGCGRFGNVGRICRFFLWAVVDI